MMADAPPSIPASGSMHRHRLLAKWLGITTTQHEPVVFMREDCFVCRSEGLTSRPEILVVADGREIVANVFRTAGDILAEDEIGMSEARHFPDGESHVTLPESLAGRQVVFNCTLAHPDPKLAPLLFVADAARDIGATKVGLVAPYNAIGVVQEPGLAVQSMRSFESSSSMGGRHHA